MPEAGRALILDAVALGRPEFTRENVELFAELTLSWELRSYREALRAPGPVFFDRSAAEVVGFWTMMGAEPPAHCVRAAELFRYRPTVFLAPVWPAIYRTDAERVQTLDDAFRVQDAVRSSYLASGYQVIELPLLDVPSRVDFVLDRCGFARP